MVLRSPRIFEASLREHKAQALLRVPMLESPPRGHRNMEVFVVTLLGLALPSTMLYLANSIAHDLGLWRLMRILGRLAPYLFGSGYGGMVAFQNEVSALRELGRLSDAVALAKAQLQKPD